MRRLAAVLLAIVAAPLGASDEVPFEPSTSLFADAAACRSGLAQMVAAERPRDHVAVEGPYDVTPGDVRAHWVDVSGTGHRITEHRCLAEKMSRRSWRHSMADGDGEARTIEQMAAKAEWLKKAPAKQD